MPKPFDQLPLAPDDRVLVLAPHPDDFDAAGITLRRLHDRGNPIHLAVLAPAASGVEDADCPGGAAAKAAIREAEQRESCRFFGLPEDRVQFLRLPEDRDGHLIDSPAARQEVLAVLRQTAPALVFLPHGNDTNACHQRCWSMFEQLRPELARRPAALLIRDPKTVNCRIDVYTGFGPDEAAWKAALLRCHWTQHQRNLRRRGIGFDERILQVNRAIAAELGLDLPGAEAFELS